MLEPSVERLRLFPRFYTGTEAKVPLDSQVLKPLPSALRDRHTS